MLTVKVIRFLNLASEEASTEWSVKSTLMSLYITVEKNATHEYPTTATPSSFAVAMT